jgi:hypothetical protein
MNIIDEIAEKAGESIRGGMALPQDEFYEEEVEQLTEAIKPFIQEAFNAGRNVSEINIRGGLAYVDKIAEGTEVKLTDYDEEQIGEQTVTYVYGNEKGKVVLLREE